MDKYGEFVGVDNLHYAEIVTDTLTVYLAGAPTYLAPAAEIGGQPEVANKTTYYDNKPKNNYVTEGKTELKIVVQNVPAVMAAYLLGKVYDAASGRVYDEGQVNPPNLAIGFRYNMGADGFRYYWYLKGTFSGGAEEATSKTSDVDIKTYTLTFTAVTTDREWSIGDKLKSLKRVYADTADTAFNPAGWFTQVQTPDVVGAPPVVALSTIVPADGAETIARNSTIALTFNNKISRENVAVLNSTSGDIVAVTKAMDAAGKVLTITPSAQLTANTKFIVSVTGVVDVYGQELAATGKDFTTTA